MTDAVDAAHAIARARGLANPLTRFATGSVPVFATADGHDRGTATVTVTNTDAVPTTVVINKFLNVGASGAGDTVIAVCLLGFESRSLPRLGFVPTDGPDHWMNQIVHLKIERLEGDFALATAA